MTITLSGKVIVIVVVTFIAVVATIANKSNYSSNQLALINQLKLTLLIIIHS